MSIKSMVKSVSPPFVRRAVRNYRETTHYNRSYSQEGEDRLVCALFGYLDGPLAKGFYVDVGAFDPVTYSNTCLFYKMGWRGINIDARPGSMRSFRKLRPRDINLETAVSTKTEPLKYFEFNNAALNGFDSELVAERDNKRGFKIIKTHLIHPKSLKVILDEHMGPTDRIDLMSVDVEGHDLEVLKSNDWDRYKPTILLAEDSGYSDLARPQPTELATFLINLGYVPICKTPLTLVFAFNKAIATNEFGTKILRDWK
jgi:FkbM family methyltransferase